MRLLVGLGNPGDKFEKTRHNAGFWVVDALAKELSAGSGKDFKGGILYEARLDGEKVIFFKPTKYMNRSGSPIAQIAAYYEVSVHDILVTYDDVYIAPGSVRIRRGGGAGGHNGMKSMLEHVKPDAFARVRIGVGIYEQDPQKRMHLPPLDEYVLQPMPQNDLEATLKAIDGVLPNLLKWLRTGELAEATHHL